MRRLVVSLVLGIALLAAVSVALIAWWTRGEPAAPSVSAAVRAAAVAAVPRRPRGPGLRAGTEPSAPAPAPDDPEPGTDERRAARAPGASPIAAASAARRGALASFRRELKVGLAALDARVAPCQADGAWFTLDVETVDGGVRVTEASLAGGASGSEASVACARSVLLGETIPAPSAEPGRRWKMSFAPGSSP